MTPRRVGKGAIEGRTCTQMAFQPTTLLFAVFFWKQTKAVEAPCPKSGKASLFPKHILETCFSFSYEAITFTGGPRLPPKYL